jgi:acetyltransferase-like isoleucine patch superfamily enzyme
VVIMPGVKLGENCVVGANSVVTKSFEAGSVIAGAPAKLLRSLRQGSLG